MNRSIESLSSAYQPISMTVHAMACQPAKNAGVLMAVNAIADALPLIHGPMGCAALRKMNSFSVYTLFDRSPCTDLKEMDKVYTYLQGVYGLPVAVVGKGMKTISLCRFLCEELGFDIELLCLSGNLYGEAGDILREIEVDELLISKDQFEIEDAIRSRKVHLVFGSTMEKKVCGDLGIPLVRVSYLVLDEISITDRPYAGIEGISNLTESILNCIISQGGQV